MHRKGEVVAICHRNQVTSSHGLFSYVGARARSEKAMRTRLVFKRGGEGGGRLTI